MISPGENDKPEKVMTTERLVVPPGYREQGRLDVYITRFILNMTRAKVQRGIKEGQVSVNGKVVTRPSYPVQASDQIECRILRPPPMAVLPEPIPLDIIYEDDDIIIVNKPSGMVVHPAYGHSGGTLVNALLHHVGSAGFDVDADEDSVDDGMGLSIVNAMPSHEDDPSVRPGIVHRLDKDTSGLLVVAKSDVAHVAVARQFENRTIDRSYQAIVWGVPDPAAGRIETLLARDPRNRKRVAVSKRGGKRAVTNYTVLEALDHLSLVGFRLETGRTHQIRVHAASIGHPIFGDEVYGGTNLRRVHSSPRQRAVYAKLVKMMDGQALHAASLGFVHPTSGKRVHFEIAPPPPMADVIDALRKLI